MDAARQGYYRAFGGAPGLDYLLSDFRVAMDARGLDGEIRRKGVAIELTTDGADHTIDADEDQLQQIVLNLVRNALAATPSAGRITVRIEAVPAAGEVWLVVRDTGPGIPPALADRLFEPFFTTRAAEGGTGLGLAVVRAIVREHGGAITASSSEGAEFTVRFPARSTGVG